MFGHVTALVSLIYIKKNWSRSIQHTCSRAAAWDPHTSGVITRAACDFWRRPGRRLRSSWRKSLLKRGERAGERERESEREREREYA